MSRIYFVTGTDTGVGKTRVTCGFLSGAAGSGLKVLGLKPVSAGCEVDDGQLKNDDAIKIAAASTIQLPYQQTNPVALQRAASPHIAAALEHKHLSAERIAGICRGALMQRPDLTLVEGAGGWRVPISSRETMADLARLIGAEVILVVSLRLGCLNHALLTAEAIRRDGMKLAGWVANRAEAQPMDYEEDNLATLKSAMGAPCLGSVPYLNSGAPEDVANYLNIQALIGNKM